MGVLVAATWIGVTDELVECVVEVNLGMCEECCVSLKYMFLAWSVIEALLGMYLLSTYSAVGLVAMGVTAEVLIVIVALFFIVVFARWTVPRQKRRTKRLSSESGAGEGSSALHDDDDYDSDEDMYASGGKVSKGGSELAPLQETGAVSSDDDANERGLMYEVYG